MINIVRCVLPDGVHRFKPFTVSDYRDFLLIRNDIISKDEHEQNIVMEELLEELYPNYPRSWRPYIFLVVFTSSIGKTKIPIVWTCPKCGKNNKTMLNLSLPDLNKPKVDVAGINIELNFPNEDSDDLGHLVKNNISYVRDEENEYRWEDISDEDKLSVIDAIDIKTFENDD